MSRQRKVFGLATAGTLVGAMIGYSLRPMDPVWRYSLSAKHGRQVWRVKNVLVYSIVGAVVGFVVDTRIGGLPRRESWKFSLRMLLAAFVALAILFNGIRCFVEIINMPP